MISKRTGLAVLCAAAFAACDAADSVTGPSGPNLSGGTFPPIEQPPIEKPPLEEFLPGVPVLDPFAEDDAGAVESARGRGMWHNIQRTAIRTFAFFARTNADGTTTGQYQVDNQDVGGSRENGRVTCLAVDGDNAWIGGVITHSSNPGTEGTPRMFRVIERGHGNPPDQASFLIVTVGETCQARPPIAVQDLEEGKILVRDGGSSAPLLP